MQPAGACGHPLSCCLLCKYPSPGNCFPLLFLLPLLNQLSSCSFFFFEKKSLGKLPPPLGNKHGGAEQKTAPHQRGRRREEGGKVFSTLQRSLPKCSQVLFEWNWRFPPRLFSMLSCTGSPGGASDGKDCPNSACAEGPCLMAFS